MITIDTPLILTASSFFVISWLYAWGLLKFFRHRFAWDMASVVGIASVVCCTFTFVWMPRLWLGYNEPPNVVYSQVLVDLAIVFLMALFGMTWVRIELRKDEQAKYNEIKRLRAEVEQLQLENEQKTDEDLREEMKDLCRQVKTLNAKISSITVAIRQGGKNSLPQIEEILKGHPQGFRN